MLVACCSSVDLTPEMATVRGNCYREDLAYLTDELWLYAVGVTRQGKWFPSIEELREVADEKRRRDELERRMRADSLNRRAQLEAHKVRLALGERTDG